MTYETSPGGDSRTWQKDYMNIEAITKILIISKTTKTELATIY